MKKLKILLVGYGPRGKIWSKVVHKNKQTILVGICDINQNLKNRSPVKFYSKLIMLFWIQIQMLLSYQHLLLIV